MRVLTIETSLMRTVRFRRRKIGAEHLSGGTKLPRSLGVANGLASFQRTWLGKQQRTVMRRIQLRH